MTRIDFDPAANRLDIHIDFAPGSRFTSPACGAGNTRPMTPNRLNGGTSIPSSTPPICTPPSLCCNGALQRIGEDVSEMLDVVPAHVRVRVIRRPKYGCRACGEAVTRAPAPDRPIDGGLATEALLAHVLVSKYADHLPRYRQAPDPRVKPVGMPSPRIERRDEPANIVQPPAEPTGHFFTMPSKPKNQRSVGNRQVSTLDVDRHR